MTRTKKNTRVEWIPKLPNLRIPGKRLKRKQDLIKHLKFEYAWKLGRIGWTNQKNSKFSFVCLPISHQMNNLISIQFRNWLTDYNNTPAQIHNKHTHIHTWQIHALWKCSEWKNSICKSTKSKTNKIIFQRIRFLFKFVFNWIPSLKAFTIPQNRIIYNTYILGNVIREIRNMMNETRWKMANKITLQ